MLCQTKKDLSYTYVIFCLFSSLEQFWHRHIRRGFCWCCKNSKVHSSFEISVEDVIQGELEKPELGDFTLSEYNEKGESWLIPVCSKQVNMSIRKSKKSTKFLVFRKSLFTTIAVFENFDDS